MDERLKMLKPGDRIGIASGSRVLAVAVVAVTPDGVLYCEDTEDMGLSDVYFAGPSSIRWPDPPKAKPGVVYRREAGVSLAGTVYEFAYGMASGKLKRDFHPGAHGNHFDFTPDWQEVPE